MGVRSPLLALCLVSSLSAQSTESLPDSEASETTRLCEVAKDPAAYDQKLIRLTCFVTRGFENFQLADPDCAPVEDGFSVWVTYGGQIQSGTMYCCPGEAASKTRPKNLSVQGSEIPLQRDLVFDRFHELLEAEPDTIVRATLVGRFFAGERREHAGRAYWMGFGHLGCCSLFVIERVESFEPHSRTDLDHTAEAGSDEKEGCNPRTLRYHRTPSISHDSILTQTGNSRTTPGGQRRTSMGIQ